MFLDMRSRNLENNIVFGLKTKDEVFFMTYLMGTETWYFILPAYFCVMLKLYGSLQGYRMLVDVKNYPGTICHILTSIRT